MPGQLIGNLILWLIVAIIVIAIVYGAMNWLCRRSTKPSSAGGGANQRSADGRRRSSPKTKK